MVKTMAYQHSTPMGLEGQLLLKLYLFFLDEI
jgi:hypothetical protein